MMDYFTRAGRDGIHQVEREIKCIRYGHVTTVRVSGPPGVHIQMAVPCDRCGKVINHHVWGRFDDSVIVDPEC